MGAPPSAKSKMDRLPSHYLKKGKLDEDIERKSEISRKDSRLEC